MKLKIKYIIAFLPLFLLGCEGFRFQGTMCDSLQPGEVSTECHAYSEEEAEKASETEVKKAGECLDCNKAEKIEIRREKK